jgi:hypothetical protein
MAFIPALLFLFPSNRSPRMSEFLRPVDAADFRISPQ